MFYIKKMKWMKTESLGACTGDKNSNLQTALCFKLLFQIRKMMKQSSAYSLSPVKTCILACPWLHAESWILTNKAKTKYVQRYYSDASLKTLKCSSALSKPSRWHSLANFGDCTHFGLSAVYSVFTNVFKLIHCNDCQFNELLKDIHAFVVQSVTKIE